MNVFIDFEYGDKQFLVRNKENTIKYHALDMISVGIRSDSFDYYAISNEFDVKLNMESKWMRENVLIHIYNEYKHDVKGEFNQNTIRNIIKKYGKSKIEIANDIYNLINPHFQEYYNGSILDVLIDSDVDSDKHSRINEINNIEYMPNEATFYGWHCESDWNCLCQLYNNMASLPKGYSMDMFDVKQMLIEICNDYKGSLEPYIIKEAISQHPNYPKNQNLHNPLSDAIWTKDMYEFLKNVKEQCKKNSF